MPKKLTYEFVKDKFEKENYIPKFTEYINAKTKLDYICPGGHQHSITWGHWSQGKRCPFCANKAKKNIEFIDGEFSKEAGTLISTDYIDAHTKLDYICLNNHGHSITWDNWNHGKRCPKCSNNGTSKFEKEVKKFILDQDQEILENDRSLVKNPNTGWFLELDILFSCKTKAIECNGVYWHSKPDVIKRDKIKQAQCKKLGINLLTIEDTMWYNVSEKCKNLIKAFILE